MDSRLRGNDGIKDAIRRVACSVSLLFLAGCGKGVLNPQGPIGAAERTILVNALAIMLAIVVPTIIASLVFAWWFRAGNPRAKRLPDWQYSGRIELIVWSIPILVIMFLGGLIWVGSHRLDPYQPIASRAAPIEVQVVALDWKWLFLYPGQNIASVNQLVVPVGVPVHFTLTSGSVMNSFFVPQLGGQIAVMNGMVTQLSLQADKPGTYRGQSAQFSGDGFSGMGFTLRAVPQADYDAWIAGAHAGGPSLDLPAYRALARQSQNVPPTTWRAIQPGLFEAIAHQQVPPAGGPETH
ncbi:ubiquinol oxidase subunit II [Sphingomonas sp. MMS24-J13]|uniref:ubiquinol oxidase subunit II n=1 Tax=Sphingomonas sp. MMS24-J13 TaxID=3238686 RepID=UPI00384D2A03